MINEELKRNKDFKCGFVSIIGEPNVGKSTLLNSILNTKISITTKKPQTTRKKILGIFSDESAQIIFYDTPGIIEPRYLLQQKMVDSINAALGESDIVLAMCDTSKKSLLNIESKILQHFQKQKINKPIFLIINKIDLIKKEETIKIVNDLSKQYPFQEIFPISATKKFNIKELVETLKKYLPVSPPYYPADQLSNESERFFISEIIREKIFELYGEEIPYSTEVRILDYKERTKKKDYISIEIFVERDTQRMILIGGNGSAIKKLGEKAREEIELFLNKGVFLEIFVKVKDNWRNSDFYMKQFGYEN